LGFYIAAIVARDWHTIPSFYATFSCACGGDPRFLSEALAEGLAVDDCHDVGGYRSSVGRSDL